MRGAAVSVGRRRHDEVTRLERGEWRGAAEANSTMVRASQLAADVSASICALSSEDARAVCCGVWCAHGCRRRIDSTALRDAFAPHRILRTIPACSVVVSASPPLPSCCAAPSPAPPALPCLFASSHCGDSIGVAAATKERKGKEMRSMQMRCDRRLPPTTEMMR